MSRIPGAWALPAERSPPTRRSRARSCATSRRRWTCATCRTSSSSARWSDPARHPERWELATAYLGLVPLGIDPRVPADTHWHRGRRAAGDRLRPRHDRPRRTRSAARQALVLEHRLRARTRHVHPRRAPRRLRGGTRLRGLGDEPQARAAASRCDRGGREAPRARPGGRATRRALPVPGPAPRGDGPVRRSPPACVVRAAAAAARSSAAALKSARLESDQVAHAALSNMARPHRAREPRGRGGCSGGRLLARRHTAPAPVEGYTASRTSAVTSAAMAIATMMCARSQIATTAAPTPTTRASTSIC